ncbi:MAG: MFS transporter [Candidatus Calescibacterium sp.]|nr:MFS transporter [Candidatus Calescibacterium sp.]MCX7733523.1 MFS transporter [bacterium]MDW8087236.1 MFS transporter [Candidatus Calescibacterium sp.]
MQSDSHQYSLKHIFYSAFLIFTAILGIGFIIPFLPDFSKRVGSEAFVGLIYSGFAFARLFAVPLSSMISDKIGRKPVIIVGLIIYSVTSFLYVISHDLVSLFFVRLVHGLASSMILPVSFAYALDYTKPGKEGFSASILGGSLLLGFGLGPVIGGFIGDQLGENYAFYFMGSMGIFSLIYSSIFMVDRNVQTKKSQEKIIDMIKEIFSSRIFITAFTIWFFIMFQRGVVISYFPLFLENSGFTKTSVGFFLTIYAILSSLLQYASGSFVDKFSNKFVPSFIFAIVSYCLLFPFYFGQNGFVIFSAILSGVMSSMVYPFIMAELGAEAKKKQKIGGTIGFLDWAFSLGNILGPTSMGLVSKYTGINLMFVVLCFFGFISLAIIYAVYKRSEKNSISY